MNNNQKKKKKVTNQTTWYRELFTITQRNRERERGFICGLYKTTQENKNNNYGADYGQINLTPSSPDTNIHTSSRNTDYLRVYNTLSGQIKLTLKKKYIFSKVFCPQLYFFFFYFIVDDVRSSVKKIWNNNT